MKAVITYHSIDPSGSVISVDEATFAAHMAWLAANVAVLPLRELLDSPCESAVALTFDDGFQNFADAALPHLVKFNLPATVFVTTDLVGKTNEWSLGPPPAVPHLPLMDWHVLESVRKHGITIGSHTRTHPNLKHTADQMHTEIAGSADIIARRLGNRPQEFSYPYGNYDETVVAAARATYAIACTTELRAISPQTDPLRMPRLDAYYFRRPGLLERFGSAAFRRFIWVRRNGRAVRRALVADGGRG